MSIQKPLEGIRVVELANYVAGPTCGRLLADWGAEVIRVESFGGDIWRFYGTNCHCKADEGENPLFDLYNANKKDILINTKTEEGNAIFHKLLSTADVFLTNNRYKSLVKSGLDYESLKEKYPRLIYALLSGYGLEGPDANTPGYDGVAFFSRGGYLTGLAEPSGYPTTAPGCAGDCTSGTTLFGGVCAALYGREKTGKGDMVVVSLFGTSVWVGASLAVMTDAHNGEVYPKQREIMHPVYTFYRCKDGEWIQLSIMEYERYAPGLSAALDIPNLLDNPKFSTTASMMGEGRADIIHTLEAAFAKWNCADIMPRLKEQDIVFDRLRKFNEVTQDEQALANDYVRTITNPNGSVVNLPMSPIKSYNIGKMEYKPGPLMGEHTVEVMKNIGYTDEEIAKYEASGAIKAHK